MKNSNTCKKYRIKEFFWKGHIRYQPQKKGWLFWHAMAPDGAFYFLRLYHLPFFFETLERAQEHIKNHKIDEDIKEKRMSEIEEAKKNFGKTKYICCDE